MSSAQTTIVVRDGNNNLKSLLAIDPTGIGAGSYVTVQSLADDSGAPVSNTNPLAVGVVVNSSTTDVASSTKTVTSTSAPITPGVNVISYRVSIPVTSVSGTTPVLDIIIQESDDGINWSDVYHIPRISSTGIFNTPVLTYTGGLIRYVQTIGGASPSFTYGINRILVGAGENKILRQIFDRTTSLSTFNATSSTLSTLGATNVQLCLYLNNVGTAPSLALQGSDDNGASWYPLNTLSNTSPAITGVANTSTSMTINNVHAHQIRAIVTAAGTSINSGYYILLKAFD